jgi:hypothetical protein
MECRTGGETDCWSVLEERRSEKAERVIGRKSGWSTLITVVQKKRERIRKFRYQQTGRVWWGQERGTYGGRGARYRNNMNSEPRPS